MKRFLSWFAAAVLLLQSVATSLVYAQDVNDNVEFDSTPAVETTVVDQASDDSIGGGGW